MALIKTSIKHIKIWGVRVYIINVHVTKKNLDDRSYEATTVVIIYWNPDQTFVIHIGHHVWFDEYNDYCWESR